MPKRNAKAGHTQRKSLTWTARVMEERMENVSGCCRGLAHPRKPSGSVVVSHLPFKDLVQTLCGSQVDIRSI